MLYGINTLGVLGENHVAALKDTLIPLFLFFIVLNSVRDRRGIVWVLAATMLPLPYMFRVYYNQVTNYMSWHYTDKLRNVSGTFMELGSNEIAAFYAGYTLVLIAIFLYIKQVKTRLVLAGLLFLNLYSLLYSYSRGSWMSFVIGVGILGWFINRKATIIACVLVALFSGSVITLFPVSVQERYSTIFVEKEEERDTSAASRFWLWENAMNEYAKSPVFGIGFHVFHHVNPYEGKDTHNYYVKVLTEQGLVGVLILLVLLWRSARSSLDLFRSTDDRLYKALGIGMLSCMGAFLLGNMFGDRFTHYPLITYFWVYLALVLRARHLVEQESQLSGDNIGRIPKPS
jgi:O-antigen ligase